MGFGPVGAKGQQVDMRRAMPLVRDYLGRLGFLDRNINVSVETFVVTRDFKAERKLWTADCSDANGRYLGFLTIDAASGEVLTAICNRHEPPGIPRVVMSRDQAVSMAARVVRSCAAMYVSEPLRMLEGPELSGDLWIVTLHSRRRTSTVSFDSRTGALTAFSQRPLKRSVGRSETATTST